MLFEQRYVDQWSVAGTVRWLQQHRGITISETLLRSYFDRVDQKLTEDAPGLLYDAEDGAIHRDY